MPKILMAEQHCTLQLPMRMKLVQEYFYKLEVSAFFVVVTITYSYAQITLNVFLKKGNFMKCIFSMFDNKYVALIICPQATAFATILSNCGKYFHNNNNDKL